MKTQRKKRLGLLALVVLTFGLMVACILYALSQNLNLYYPPAEVAAGIAPLTKTIRVGGMVKDHSVKRDPDSLAVDFVLTDFQAEVTVHYVGILPDLFREGQGVIVRGKLIDKQQFKAEEVLAKHGEDYMPPEVANSLAARQVNEQ